jgi:AcrR family transcriptional regulator
MASRAPQGTGRAVGGRRAFDRATKARLLAAYDAAEGPSARRAFLQHEGLYHSHISAWRRQLAAGSPRSTRSSGSESQRPPRSRPINAGEIVEAAIAVLDASGGRPITMAEVAERLGVAPMALYRHFRSHNDLLNEVAWALLSRRRVLLDEGAGWQARLRAWMTSAHENAVAYPQLTHLIASGASPAWLVNSAELLEILELAGVQGDAELTRVSYWIATTVMGHAMVAALTPGDAPTRQFSAALVRLPDRDAARVARVLPGMAELQPERLDVVVDIVIAALPRIAHLDGGD